MSLALIALYSRGASSSISKGSECFPKLSDQPSIAVVNQVTRPHPYTACTHLFCKGRLEPQRGGIIVVYAVHRPSIPRSSGCTVVQIGCAGGIRPSNASNCTGKNRLPLCGVFSAAKKVEIGRIRHVAPISVIIGSPTWTRWFARLCTLIIVAVPWKRQDKFGRWHLSNHTHTHNHSECFANAAYKLRNDVSA